MNFKLYNKLTIWAKILILISLFLICFSIFSVKQEGFKNNKTFTFEDSYEFFLKRLGWKDN